MESPDSTSHTSTDQAAQTASLRPESAAAVAAAAAATAVEKSGAVAKVPKSVSTGALSLMIPGGKSQKHTAMFTAEG